MTESTDNLNKEQDDMDNNNGTPRDSDLPSTNNSQGEPTDSEIHANAADADTPISLDKDINELEPKDTGPIVDGYEYDAATINDSSLHGEGSEYGEHHDSEEDMYQDELDAEFGEGSVEVDDGSDYIPVPGVDDEYYENELGVDPDEVTDGYIYPGDHSDESALLLSQMYGVGGVIRENAHLTQNVKNYRKNFFLACLVSIVLAILLVVLVIAISSYPKIRYIPTFDNRAICEVTPENNPNITDVSIADFAKDAVLNLYTFDYVNHEGQINSTLERWFTPKGRIDTINAMTAINILEFVKQNALTLQAGTTAAAKIEQKGRTPNGEPYWIVRFPLIIDIYSGGAQPEDTQQYIVTVRVVASTASAQNPKGLGVVSATLAPTN